jgi:hypothetical protein
VEVLDSFQISMDRICREALRAGKAPSASNFTRAELQSVIGYEDRYEQLLSQVAVNCCAADKLKILLEEIERRKLKILEMTMLIKISWRSIRVWNIWPECRKEARLSWFTKASQT